MLETVLLVLFRFFVVAIFSVGLLAVGLSVLNRFAPGLANRAYKAIFGRELPVPADAGEGWLATPGVERPADRNRPLRVYVAASSREMPRVDRALASLDTLANVEVTYRWIDDMRSAGKSDKDLTEFEARVAADKCIAGVRTADVFWLLYPIEPTRGAWAELGYATAMHELMPRSMRVVVSHELDLAPGSPPGTAACIFTRKPLGWRDGDPIWFELGSDEEGFAAVIGVALAWQKLGASS